MDKQKVKEEIKWKDLKIQLFEISDPYSIPFNSISNIIAVNEANKIVWKAETPKTRHDCYFHIKLDTNRQLLIANSGIGYQYLLNPDNGNIIEYNLIK